MTSRHSRRSPPRRSGRPSCRSRSTGPDAISVNQPMTYRVEVKNEGEAPARQARLRVEVDRDTKLIRMSRSEPGDADPRVEGSTLHWDLGTIDPGKEVDVSFTVVGHQEAELKHQAAAESACDRGGDFARTVTANANVQTRLLTYPALLLELVDRTDPVRVGGTETYRITVVNQGSGADENVKVTLRVPDQFKLVEASGPGESKADGQTVTLGPVDRLPPQERSRLGRPVQGRGPRRCADEGHAHQPVSAGGPAGRLDRVHSDRRPRLGASRR